MTTTIEKLAEAKRLLEEVHTELYGIKGQHLIRCATYEVYRTFKHVREAMDNIKQHKEQADERPTE